MALREWIFEFILHVDFRQWYNCRVKSMKLSTVLTVLKWVALVFIAGFIGYFGRHLSQMIIARFGKKKQDGSRESIPSPTRAEPDYKIEKKRLKQKQKIEKKRAKGKS